MGKPRSSWSGQRISARPTRSSAQLAAGKSGRQPPHEPQCKSATACDFTLRLVGRPPSDALVDGFLRPGIGPTVPLFSSSGDLGWRALRRVRDKSEIVRHGMHEMSADIEKAKSTLFEFLSAMKEWNNKFATLFEHGGRRRRGDQAEAELRPIYEKYVATINQGPLAIAVGYSRNLILTQKK